jgi:hypothetical protein
MLTSRLICNAVTSYKRHKYTGPDRAINPNIVSPTLQPDMADLQYYAYDGVGKRNQQNFRYSQAVRVGDRIECAGQGTFIPYS